MTVVDVYSGYTPREQFVPFHTTDKRWRCLVCHRRAGKTVASINQLIRTAITCELPNPRVAYMAPLRSQAKDVAWGYLRQYTADIPGAVANESELRVDLPGGGRVRLYGADNPDALRGVYLDECVLDEFADMRPALLPEVVRPALSDRKGSLTIIGTPKGHNSFHRVWEQAKADDEWFALELKASDTGIVDEEELKSLRKLMSEDEYAQEFECSFEAAIQGAYYAHLVAEARRQNRIGRIGADPLMATRAYFDIGGTGARADAVSIWIAQFVGREIRVLDYYEAQGQPLAVHVEWLRSRGYQKAEIFLPHDGIQSDKVHSVSFDSALRDAGFSVQTVPNQGAGAARMRIEATRRRFPLIWFNEETTAAGIEALIAYHERRDEMRNIGLGPDHDWSSHAADAFGLMCCVYQVPEALEDSQKVRDLMAGLRKRVL